MTFYSHYDLVLFLKFLAKKFYNRRDLLVVKQHIPTIMHGAVCPSTPHVLYIRDVQQLLAPPGRLLQPLPPQVPHLVAQQVVFFPIPL